MYSRVILTSNPRLNFNQNRTYKSKCLKQKLSIRYEFRFTSLIVPSTSFSYKTNFTQDSTEAPLPRRLSIKRSYLLLSWIHYLTTATRHEKDLMLPRVAILPTRRKFYTITKAPMAHKTNSKEQFALSFYNYKFSVNLPIDTDETDTISNSICEGGVTLSKTKENMPVFETNLLSLKYYLTKYPIKDSKYFNHL